MKRLLVCLLLLLAAPLRAGLILEASVDSLELVTSSTATIDYQCSWTDGTTTNFNPSKSVGQITSVTTTTIVAAPSASTQRNVLQCSIHHSGTSGSNSVTVQRDVSGTNVEIIDTSLAVGESIILTQDGTWQILNSTGVQKTQSPDIGYNGKVYGWLKAGSVKDSAGYAVSSAANAGIPGAWSPGSPGVNGWATDCSAANNAADPAGATQLGTHVLQDPASGNLYLTQIALGGSVAAEQLEVIDVLWYNTGLTVTTTTAQAFTTPTLPARDINGSTNGNGVNLALFTTTANTNAGVISTTTASYTDSDGNTSQTATFAGMVGFQAPATPVITSWMPFQLAAGDRGMRSVQSITLATSYGGGALSAVLYRSLITIPNPTANAASLVTLPSPGVRIYPNTCIWVILRGTASAASVSGSYTIMER